MFRYTVSILFALGGPLFSQVSGTISGSVSDPSGAAVPKARVALTLPGNSVHVLEATTTTSGLFTLIAVRADSYDLSVEAPGFAPFKIERLIVDEARQTVLPPIQLQIPSVAASVDVAAPPNVETGNAELSETITHDQLQRLPNRGRNPLLFLPTQPGIVGQTINGQRSAYTDYRLDGISIDDDYFRTSTLSSLAGYLLLDQVGEITVSTSNMNSALSGASHVSLTAPSGTNQFHGSAYWYSQNDAYASNTWLNNSLRIRTTPPLNQNQAGVSFGGPVLRNKLLLYANYEGLRRRQHVYFNRTVLSDDARNGVLTYQDAQGSVHKANILQLAGVSADPFVQKLLAQVPTGITSFEIGDSQPVLLKNTGNHRVPVGINNSLGNATAKLDYIRSPRQVFSASYIRNHIYAENPGNGGYTVVPTSNADSAYQLAAVVWRWNPGPKVTNEVRGGASISPGAQRNSTQLGSFILDNLLFTSPVNTAPNSGRHTGSAHLTDNGSYSQGRHAFSFGGELQQIRTLSFFDFLVVPHYGIGIGTGNPGLTGAQLPGIGASDLNTANQLLATLAGYVTSYSERFNVTSRTSGFVPGARFQRHFQENNFNLYFQDQWKVLPRLNLTLGLRYDCFGVVNERDGLNLLPVIQNGGPLATLRSNATLDFAGSVAGRPWYHPDRNNLAPSVGLAWDVFGNGRTAFRAGYAVRYVNDQIMFATDQTTELNDGLSATSQRSGLSGRVSTGLPPIPVPSVQVPRTAADNFSTNSFSTLGLIDPNLRTPYVQEWVAGIEHTVRGMVIQAHYVGNHGVKEWRGIDYNQVLLRENGFLDDFLRAYNNGNLSLQATGVFNPSYNPAVPGSQQLTLLPLLPSQGNLASASVRNLIQTGQAGTLAYVYQTNRANGSFNFMPNPYAGAAYLLENVARSNYNAIQLEARRRVGSLIQFQVSYTYAKALTDDLDSATRQDPMLDISNNSLERARASNDLRHALKGNFVVSLPLGDGHILNYRPLHLFLDGWSASSSFAKQSGLPFSVLSSRGTLSQSQNSSYNTANTTLTAGQLNGVLGVRYTPTGPYYVAASAIGPDGRAVAPDGRSPFPGQIFSEPSPGTVGALQRNMFSGPGSFTLDASLMKQTRITERQSIETRLDAFNALNHPTWGVGNATIDSPNFGRLNGGSQRIIQLGLRYSF